MIGITNYEVLEGLYEEMTKITDDMVDQIKKAKGIVNKMNNNDHWVGKGFDGYEKKFNALASDFGAFCNDIYKINNNIHSAIEKYKYTDALVQAKINGAVQ